MTLDARTLLLALAPTLMAVECDTATPPPDACAIADADGDGADRIDCGGFDCDDDDMQRYPGATEICDAMNRDEDCDPWTIGERDLDRDGFVDMTCCNVDSDGEMYCGEDCNDQQAGTHPVQNESCNSVDDDCDSVVDEGVLMTLYLDADRDGYGTGAPESRCQLTPGFSYLSNDCNDKNAAIVPGAMTCASSTTYQLCGSDGEWSAAAACGAQALCIGQPNGSGICSN